MSVELISVLVAVLAIGATLAGLILTSNRGLRQDMREDMGQLRQGINELRGEIGELRERMAHLEELLDLLLPERHFRNQRNIETALNAHCRPSLPGPNGLPSSAGEVSSDRTLVVWSRVRHTFTLASSALLLSQKKLQAPPRRASRLRPAASPAGLQLVLSYG